MVAAGLLLSSCTAGAAPSATLPSSTVTSAPGSAAATTAPALRVEVVADGLDHPWDVARAPDGTLLVDERPGRLRAVLPDGTVRQLRADLDDVFARGETGLMGLVLDPAFADNRRFYTCSGRTDGGADGGPSIAVVAWTVTEDWTSATRVADPLLGGIPVNERIGRHGGCRLRFAPDGALLVSTGDNAVGTNAQDRSVLGGKVLRIDAATGQPAAGNPFAGAPGAEAYLYTYGQRNVQGLAIRPGSGQVYAVEQGTSRDDEVTLLRAGGNGGYDPDGVGGRYDESVPMTDAEFADVMPASWASGPSTIATCGGTFLDGPQWAGYDGLLLLGALKGRGVLALRLDDDGRLVQQFRIPELEGTYGRIRTVQQEADGALYVTTDNGGDEDVVLKVTAGR